MTSVGAALLWQQRAEARAAELLSRAVTAEAELRNYQVWRRVVWHRAASMGGERVLLD